MIILLFIHIVLLIHFHLESDKKIKRLENDVVVLNDFKDYYLLSDELFDIEQKIEDAKDVENYELCKSLSIIKDALNKELDELELKIYK